MPTKMNRGEKACTGMGRTMQQRHSSLPRWRLLYTVSASDDAGFPFANTRRRYARRALIPHPSPSPTKQTPSSSSSLVLYSVLITSDPIRRLTGVPPPNPCQPRFLPPPLSSPPIAIPDQTPQPQPIRIIITSVIHYRNTIRM